MILFMKEGKNNDHYYVSNGPSCDGYMWFGFVLSERYTEGKSIVGTCKPLFCPEYEQQEM